MKQIELEVRGPIPDSHVSDVITFLDKHALFIARKHRIFIDYTTLLPGHTFESREKDIRARVTDGIPEMIIKIGSWGTKNEARKEISLTLQKGQFPTLVSAYAALGYKRGFLCERYTHLYTYKDTEVVLVEVPNHSWSFEIEIMAESEKDKEATHKKLRTICRELNLKPYQGSEFYDYMRRLNTENSILYDYDTMGEEFFKRYEL